MVKSGLGDIGQGRVVSVTTCPGCGGNLRVRKTRLGSELQCTRCDVRYGVQKNSTGKTVDAAVAVADPFGTWSKL